MCKGNCVKSYVVVHNIAKRHNVGTLARSATAFGVSELILVGRRDFNAFGSHGSTSHLCFRHFFSLLDARNFLKERDCDICGVEITDNALPVNQHPFKRSTAFLLGNEAMPLLQYQVDPSVNLTKASLSRASNACGALHKRQHSTERTEMESPCSFGAQARVRPAYHVHIRVLST
ncbi:hypothetical protein Cgig2_012619 [Carnegiea gigantea]|uniref:tRNA/rRNA methyltransferase SpoU type domain-containing protein n=1 Tax=Carnegiea gigantea TaxID=171969 RepID=A0A9Q1JJD9_9CARY|nr:hypothetical protein Cgig2_012619 [Carnegiea gigantea]